MGSIGRWLLRYTVVLSLLGAGVVHAAPPRQAPIVSPAAVSTPTPVANPNHAVTTPQSYEIKPGDTLWRVALEIGVDLAAMPCTVAPDFSPDQPLVIGNILTVLPPDQGCHTVQPGETLTIISALYGVTPEQIYAIPWNNLQTILPVAKFKELSQTVALPPGRHLRVLRQSSASPPLITPNLTDDAAQRGDDSSFLTWMLQQPVDTSPFAVLAVGGPFADLLGSPHSVTDRALRPINQPGVVPANWPYGSGLFTWPLAGWLTQGYRYDHRALDIAAPAGTPVAAADRGVVLRAGWNAQGYGLFVIIDHNIDYVTLYAHLSEILVEEGQVIAQGEIVGKVGSTGNSTGPHLHFEIRDFGRLTNPLELLTSASAR
ncbi:MAG: peptidoglycan DD-metalloendopeptidase family protein [Caldilineaceae bacterium]